MKRILIVGYFGHGNPGDEAAKLLLCSELEARGLEYRIFGEGKPTALKKLLTLSDALCDSSAVVFCGGNLLQNETGNLSLIYYLSIIRAPAKLKIPVFFAFSGIGEIRGSLARRLTQKALSRVELFGARTSFDLSLAHSLGVREVFLTADIAFTLPQRKFKKRDTFAYIPKVESPSLEKKLKDIADKLSLRPTVIPFFAECDEKLCAAVAKRLNAPTVSGNLDRIFEELACCRFTVSDRLHGGIFSLVAHTPTFLSDRQQKCRALTYELGMRSGELGIKSPLISTDAICVEKIKELGAYNSEFDILLNSLRFSSELGLSKLIRRLLGAVIL